MRNERRGGRRPGLRGARPGSIEYERIYMRRTFGLSADFATLQDLQLIKRILMYETPMVTKEVLNLLSYWDERGDIELERFNVILTRYLNGSTMIKGNAPKPKLDINGLLTRTTLKTYEMAVTYCILSLTNMREDELNEGTLGVYVTEAINKLKEK